MLLIISYFAAISASLAVIRFARTGGNRVVRTPATAKMVAGPVDNGDRICTSTYPVSPGWTAKAAEAEATAP